MEIVKTIVSEKGDLIKQDLIKVGKGFLIALAGATVAFLSDLTGVIDFSQYGEFSPIIALVVGSFCSALVNLIKKWIEESNYKAISTKK
jgi:hypothetical protein